MLNTNINVKMCDAADQNQHYIISKNTDKKGNHFNTYQVIPRTNRSLALHFADEGLTVKPFDSRDKSIGFNFSPIF